MNRLYQSIFAIIFLIVTQIVIAQTPTCENQSMVFIVSSNQAYVSATGSAGAGQTPTYVLSLKPVNGKLLYYTTGSNRILGQLTPEAFLTAWSRARQQNTDISPLGVLVAFEQKTKAQKNNTSSSSSSSSVDNGYLVSVSNPTYDPNEKALHFTIANTKQTDIPTGLFNQANFIIEMPLSDPSIVN